jgi:hypothetical protein
VLDKKTGLGIKSILHLSDLQIKILCRAGRYAAFSVMSLDIVKLVK